MNESHGRSHTSLENESVFDGFQDDSSSKTSTESFRQSFIHPFCRLTGFLPSICLTDVFLLLDVCCYSALRNLRAAAFS